MSKFLKLPIRLRTYILGHLPLLPLLGYLLWQGNQPLDPVMVGGLVLGSIVFSVWTVDLTILQGKMSTTSALVVLALLVQGPQAAVLCSAVGGFVSTVMVQQKGSWKVHFRLPEWYRILFNVCNCAISVGFSALLFAVVQDAVHSEIGPLAGVIVFTASYFLINTVGISVACAFQQNLSWADVWKENFLWTAPGFFASGSAAVGIHALYQHMGPWSLMFLPPVWVIYLSYRLYMERIHLFTDKVKQDMTHIQELNQLNRAIIASLATAIDAKDRYTCSHINRVQHYAMTLAQAAGLAGPDLEAVATGALVHDIGKLGIPDHILGKPGKLSLEEFQRMQGHVAIGVEILSPIPFPFPVVDVVRAHHERWDGLGYPAGLKGEDIPIGARIISLVDVFDALTSNRPYRRAMTYDEALRVLSEGAGKQFDPLLVELFKSVLPSAMAEIEQMEKQEQERAAAASSQVDTGSALAQISQAAAEMAAVCDVAHSLAEQENIEQIMDVVIQRALSLIPADTAVIYLQAEELPELVASAIGGKYQDKLAGMSIQFGEGVAGWVAEHQQPRVNATAALDVARRFTPEENIELSAATVVPLVHGPDNIGVLAVYTVGYNVLSDHHLRVLNILAEHAASAIQNSRRIERHRELAYTDPLTGLMNSRGLVRQLERLIARDRDGRGSGEAEEFSVVMLDLDRFKDVNDTLGHIRGDDLLREVAEKLMRLSRPGDIVCRYAGDEFVILLPRSTREKAERVAQRVRNAIDLIPVVEGRVKVGASVGVANYAEDGVEGRALINVADRRMYEDKFQRRRGAVSDRAGHGAAEPVAPAA